METKSGRWSLVGGECKLEDISNPKCGNLDSNFQKREKSLKEGGTGRSKNIAIKKDI